MTFNITPWPRNASNEQKISWLKENQHFCIKPFIYSHISTHNDQLISSPCCNYINDTNPQLASVPFDQQFKELREDIKNGVKNNRCQRCWNSEKTSNVSERIRDIIYHNDNYIDSILDGTNKYYNLLIKFSNFCNLACRSCFPDSSSTYSSLVNIPVTKSISTDLKDTIHWQTVIDRVNEALGEHNMINIALIGGETMIQPGAELLLDYIKSKNAKHRVTLGITSNFTTINENMLKDLNEYWQVNITASIDSTGTNYHYVRWPAQFSKIQNNLKRFYQLQGNYKNVKLSITSVFSLNNIFYINEYLDFITQCLEENPATLVGAMFLEEPRIISIENLPIKYRPALLKYINQAVKNPILNHPSIRTMKQFLIDVQTFLNNGQVIHDQKLFNSFLKFTADFDNRTKCYFKDFNERLYNELDSDDKAAYFKYLKV